MDVSGGGVVFVEKGKEEEMGLLPALFIGNCETRFLCAIETNHTEPLT